MTRALYRWGVAAYIAAAVVGERTQPLPARAFVALHRARVRHARRVYLRELDRA